VRDPDSRHLYAYGEGDPVGKWDADGAFWYRVGGAQTVKSLSTRFLGRSTYWPYIYNRNRYQIGAGLTLSAGTCIWIPDWDFRRLDQCGTHKARTGGTDDRTLRAASKLGVDWYGLTEQRLRQVTEEVTGYRQDVAWWAWPSTLADRVTRYVSWAALARATDIGFGSTGGGRAHGLRLIWGSRLPAYLGDRTNMFTIGNSVYIRPGYIPNDAGLAHEYIHTLEYLGTGRIEVVGRYGLEELFSGSFGSGSASNRLEAIAYLWQGWITAYGQAGIVSKPKLPWSIWSILDVL
jgi:hypothetical protein